MIARLRLASRYALAVCLWPIIHTYDRLTGVRPPASFRAGLDWARGVRRPVIPTGTRPAVVRRRLRPEETR